MTGKPESKKAVDTLRKQAADAATPAMVKLNNAMGPSDMAAIKQRVNQMTEQVVQQNLGSFMFRMVTAETTNGLLQQEIQRQDTVIMALRARVAELEGGRGAPDPEAQSN